MLTQEQDRTNLDVEEMDEFAVHVVKSLETFALTALQIVVVVVAAADVVAIL